MMNSKKSFSLIILSVIIFLSFISSEKINQTISEQGETVPAVNPQSVEIQKIANAYGNLPLIFEPNYGQTDERVKFVSRGHGYGLFLTNDGAVLALRNSKCDSAQNKTQPCESAAVRMRIQNANENPKISGAEQSESKTNYFTGNDPEKWQTDVPNFLKVRYESVYEGVDLVYYGNQRRLEYDFVIQPNADPNQIKLKFDGIKNAEIEEQTGDLLLETEIGTVRQHAPFVYQEINGERQQIAARYLLAKNIEQNVEEFSINFGLGNYDKTKTLVIDPILAYGSYLGGNAFDEGRAIAVDSQGNAYIAGTAASRDFPTTAGTIKPVLLPRVDPPTFYWSDAFITKMNPTGTALVFSTYFGGRTGQESATGVVVDAQGNVSIGGFTTSSDLPIVSAYQSAFGGGNDAFAAKLNSSGTAIVFSTYLGGSGGDSGGKIALNQTTGDTVFVGTTTSPNFPTTPGAYKPKLCDTPQSCSGISYNGSYAVKLSANGGAVYSTLFDATINAVALDANDNAVIGGSVNNINFPTTPGAFQTASSGGIEGFVSKLNPTGNTLVYSTFLGGGSQSDRVKGLAVDSAGNIYAVGQTQNAGFPTTPGAFDQTYNGGEDGFLTKLNPAGSALVYSTFFGGTGKDEPFAIGLGENNEVFVAGETLGGLTFPLRNSITGMQGTIFLTRFNADASALVFSTLLGFGGAYDLAVDAENNAYITGHATNIPVTPNGFQIIRGGGDVTNTSKDAFVMKIAPTDENVQGYAVSGTISDLNHGFQNDYTPIVVTVTGTVNRSYSLPYSSNGNSPYYFGNLPAGGNYTVTARKVGYAVEPESVVFNNLGANQSADFTILRNRRPEGVITNPKYGATYNAPATINITATASDPDGDAIQKVDFVAYHSTLGSIPLGTDTTAPYEFTWENVPVGTWALHAIPTDSKGLRGYSTPVVHVFVVDPTGASVSITSPTEGQTFIEGDYVPISVSVSSSVNVVEVRDQQSNLIVRMTSSPWTYQWRVMQPGNYTLTARAFTQSGMEATSAPVSFTVNPINHQISGRIIHSITNSGIGGVTLNLSSSTNPNVSAQTTTDSSGNYLFTNLGTTPYDGVTITPVSSGFNFNPQARNISFLGFIIWSNQNFTAIPETQISVAMTSPTSGQRFIAPATVNLAASAQSGAGSITKVEFYRQQGGGGVLLATDTEAPYEHQLTNVSAGQYSYFARAVDSTQAIADSASVSIQVNAPPSTIRLQGSITSPFSFPMVGIPVKLTGTVNGNPVDQTSITNLNGAYGFFNLAVGGNYTITPQGTGGQTFTPPSFSVTNATSDNFNVNFIASDANQPPTVQFNSPTDGATFTMPASIPINVTATDPDGTIAQLTISASNGIFTTTIGQSNNGTFNAPWQPNAPGTYVLTAQARDNGGLTSFVQISITVNPPAPISISGRIVNRDSQGIEDATVELTDTALGETVATATTDANGNYTIPNVATFKNYVLRASKLNYTFSPQQRNFFNIAANQTSADYTGTISLQPSDFDGDSKTDIAVWRPETGVWHILRSNQNSYTGVLFGAGSLGDVPVPGNYDGDQKIDIAVFRSGTWYILNSSNSQMRGVVFGQAGDKPVPGDYDGDGKTDIAVFRPSNGYWYILRSSDGQFTAIQWGFGSDVPTVGDFDGDGLADIAVWRPENGTWYIRQSSDSSMRAVQFGMSGDIPLIGDFDGDKRTDIAVYRPSNGFWYVLRSSDNVFNYFHFGTADDIPVPGDYDLDGKTDLAVFRKSEGIWYVFRSATNSFSAQQFGVNGDVPVPAALIR